MKKIICICLLMFSFCSLSADEKLSFKTHEKLLKCHKFLETKDYTRAFKVLEEIEFSKLKDFDKFYVLQMKGNISLRKNNYEKALGYFEQMVALNIDKEKTNLNTIYNIAQISMQLKKYDKAILNMKEWISRSDKSKYNAYIFISQAYQVQQKLKNANTYLVKAIEISKEFPEKLYKLLFFNYYQLKEHKNTMTTIKILVKNRPNNKDYWLYLASMYSSKNQNKTAATTLEQAHRLKLLNEKEIVNLAKHLLLAKAPQKASKILTESMSKKQIKRDTKNLRLLYDTYFLSKEYLKAISVLKQLHKKTNNSRYSLDKARLYHLINKNNEAVKAYEIALSDKKLKNTPNALMELAYLFYEQSNYQKAKVYLQKASKFKKTNKQALSFLKQLP